MRVFAGLPLPEVAVKKAAVLLESMQRDYRRLNWVKQVNLHITMLFFGELSTADVDKIIRCMDQPDLKIPRIKVGFNAIGQFPARGNPRVIFIDLKGETDHISSCQQLYAQKIWASGIKPGDDKPFVPHLTIARNKQEQIKPGYLAGVQVPILDFEFDKLVLYKSVLSAAGADYIPLKTIMFQQDNI